MFLKFQPFYIASLLFLSNAVSAQSTDKSLDTVVIKENRLRMKLNDVNRNVEILTRKEIQSMPVRSIAELLQYVNGVDLRQRGPGGVQSDISIDGGSFDESLVLLNGVRLTDPQSGHNMMNLPISLDAVDHIEVLRGPAARTYGVNTLTGAINIVTRQPDKTNVTFTGYWGSSFKSNAIAGNSNYNNTGGILTLTQKSDKVSQLLTMSNNHGNGYRYNTAYKINNIYYQNRTRLGGSNLDLMAGYVSDRYGANGFYASPGDINSGEDAKNFLGAIGLTSKVNAHWTMMPRFSYRLGMDDYRYVWNPIKYQNVHRTNVYNLEWNNRVDTKSGQLGFGIEFNQVRINSTQLGKWHRNNVGASAEYKFNQLGLFDLTAGGYLNYNSTYGWQLFPGLDAGFHLTKDLRVYASVGTGQRYPTYTDLYYKTPPIYGNADLVPEKSKYVEGGFKYIHHHFSGQASYFYRRIDKYIDWIWNDSTEIYKAVQSQNLNTFGQTVNLKYSLLNKNSKIFGNTIMSLGYTHLNSDVKRLNAGEKSRYALNNLKHQFILNASSDLIPKLRLGINARWQERLTYKSYFLLDSKLSYDLPHANLFVNATNLTNITYIETGAMPLPGRWIQFGAKVSLK